MATKPSKNRCCTCGKAKAPSKCAGCLQDFCLDHLIEHRHELNQHLAQLNTQQNILREKFNEHINNTQPHSCLQKIEQWEEDSIKKIQQTAQKARQLLRKHIDEHVNEIEEKFKEITKKIRQCREQDDVIETDLLLWNNQLQQMTKQMNKSSNISIEQTLISLINNIYIKIPEFISIPIINLNAKWKRIGITVAGENSEDRNTNLLPSASHLYVDDDQTVYVVDPTTSHIVEWKKDAINGQVVIGKNGYGHRNDQLNYPMSVILNKKTDCFIITDYSNSRVVLWPRQYGTHGETIISNISCWGLTIDNEGYLYVSDPVQHEVTRWKIGDSKGIVVAGGNGSGHRLDQLNGPYYICVDQHQSVYVSDMLNHRVMKWIKDAKVGVVVAGNNSKGNSLKQLSNPRGVLVDQLGTIYIADHTNNRVMRWLKGAKEGSIIVAGWGHGRRTDKLIAPMGMAFDQENNLYVVDMISCRVLRFDIEQNSKS